AVIAGVRLDAGHDADVIGLGGVAVEDDGETLGGGADGHDVHRGADRGADGRLGDAVAVEDVALPLGGAAAVTAHRGNEEGTRPQFFQEVGDGPEDERDVGDAAAARGQRDGVAGADGAAQVQGFQGGADGAGDVL